MLVDFFLSLYSYQIYPPVSLSLIKSVRRRHDDDLPSRGVAVDDDPVIVLVSIPNILANTFAIHLHCWLPIPSCEGYPNTGKAPFVRYMTLSSAYLCWRASSIPYSSPIRPWSPPSRVAFDDGPTIRDEFPRHLVDDTDPRLLVPPVVLVGCPNRFGLVQWQPPHSHCET